MVPVRSLCATSTIARNFFPFQSIIHVNKRLLDQLLRAPGISAVHDCFWTKASLLCKSEHWHNRSAKKIIPHRSHETFTRIRARRNELAAKRVEESLQPVRIEHPHPGGSQPPSSVVGRIAYGRGTNSYLEYQQLPERKVDQEGNIINPITGNSFAIVDIKGKQHKVSEGDLIMQDRLRVDVGDLLVFTKVLLQATRDFTVIGRPIIKGAEVHMTVEEHTLTAKISVFKKKRRKNYRKMHGHRSHVTILRVEKIVFPDSTLSLTDAESIALRADAPEHVTATAA